MRETRLFLGGLVRFLRFALHHSLRDMWRNRTRTVFALICVVTGVSAVVALRSLAFMVGDELTTNLAQINRGDIRVYATRRVPELTTLSGQQLPVFNERAVEAFRAWAAEEGVALSFARLSGALPLRQVVNGQEVTAQTVAALFIEPETYPFYDRIILREPAGATLADALLSDYEAQGTPEDPRPLVISTGLARESSLGLQVGDRVRLGASNTTYEVRGIAPTSAETVLTWPSAAFLGLYVYLPLDDLQWLNEPVLPDQVFVKVPLGRDIGRVEQSLVAYLQARLGSESSFDEQLRRSTVPELAEENSEVAGVIDDMILTIGLSSLLIGGIGIVNTMLVVVNRRMLEIAVLKTLGLKAYRVTLLFLVEALLMGLIGSIIGAGVGVVLSYLVRGVGEEAFALTLEWRLYPAAMVSGLFLGVIMTTLFGFMPTLIAGQVRPAIVLRPNDAEMPPAGLVQTLLVIVAMIAVLGFLVSSIVEDALSFGPEIMLAGGGGLIGLFAGAILANRRGPVLAAPQRKHVPRLRSTIARILWGYGALAIGAAVASVIVLILSAIWRPFGIGDERPASSIVSALRRGELAWALFWLALTLGVAWLIRRYAHRAARALALTTSGMTVGGVAGAIAGLGLESLLGQTSLWRALMPFSTGVVLVEGALAVLAAVYLGYWLLVWGVSRMPPVLMTGVASLLVIALATGGAVVSTMAGRGLGMASVGVAGITGLVVWARRRSDGNRKVAGHGEEALRRQARDRDPARHLSALLLGAGAIAASVWLAKWLAWPVAAVTGGVAGAVFLGWWILLHRHYRADARLVLRELAGRRGRVALTLLGLSVGVAGLSLVTLTAGAVSHILEIQLGETVEGNLLIADPTASQGAEVAAILDTSEGVLGYSQVTTYRGVLVTLNGEDVRPLWRRGERSEGGDDADLEGMERGIPLGLIERETLDDMPSYKMVDGRPLMPGDEGQHRIMLRESFVTERLGIKAGDTLQFLFENGLGQGDDVLLQFRVVGLVSRQSEQTGLEEMGNLSVLPPGSLPDTVKPQGTATIALVDESDPRYMDQVMVALAHVPGVIAFELDALTQLAQGLLEQLNAIPTLVAWLALVAGTAIIANTVALAVQERRRQVAVMKAIGLKGWRALAMLLVENGLIGLLAGLIGGGVGLVVTVVVVLATPSPEDMRRVIEFGTLGWLMLLSIGVAIGAAMLSAWGAMREKPLQVLRYE
mgnify:CR=1 FL=1